MTAVCVWRLVAVIASLFAICVGASAGAVLRWALALALNATFPLLPLGTLVANLGGGYLIGVALAVFGAHPGWAPEWRLLVITGFLGGLTTFSTFSAEVTTLLQQGRLLWAGWAISAHVVGSLAMTLLGLATVAWFKSA
jgi:CrcB protein